MHTKLNQINIIEKNFQMDKHSVRLEPLCKQAFHSQFYNTKFKCLFNYHKLPKIHNVKLLKDLNSAKASGSDEISTHVLKECANKLEMH